MRCGELVRRRLHALVIQGAQYDVRTADPWEQYRLPNQGVSSSGGGASAALVASAWQELSERESVAALQAEWMPEAREGRDCSCQLLTRLRSDALLTLRDRARAQQKEGSGSYSSGTSRPRPRPRRPTGARLWPRKSARCGASSRASPKPSASPRAPTAGMACKRHSRWC